MLFGVYSSWGQGCKLVKSRQVHAHLETGRQDRCDIQYPNLLPHAEAAQRAAFHGAGQLGTQVYSKVILSVVEMKMV